MNEEPGAGNVRESSCQEDWLLCSRPLPADPGTDLSAERDHPGGGHRPAENRSPPAHLVAIPVRVYRRYEALRGRNGAAFSLVTIPQESHGRDGLVDGTAVLSGGMTARNPAHIPGAFLLSGTCMGCPRAQDDTRNAAGGSCPAKV